MKNLRTEFERLIEDFLALDENALKELTETDYKKYQEQLTSGKNKMQEIFYETLFTGQPDEFISRILKIYHIRLVTLSDKVYDNYNKLQGKGMDSDARQLAPGGLHLHLLRTIEELRESALHLGGAFFTSDMKIPRYSASLKSRQYQQAFAAMVPRLKRYKVATRIIDELACFFQEFENHYPVAWSYRQMEYAEKILQSIAGIMAKDVSADWPEKIWQMLIYFNLNKDQILQYCKQRMYELAIMDKSYEDARAGLRLLLKELRAMGKSVSLCYEEDHISLAAYNENILIEELDYMEKSRNDLLRETGNNTTFVYDTSIRQICLWAVINDKLNRFPIHTSAQVTRIVLGFVRTPSAPDGGSYESARKKLFEIDAATVKTWLKRKDEETSLVYENWGHLL